VQQRHALTLLETLVSLAIVAVALGLLLPAVQMARDVAARAGCASNMRQLALAAHQYAATHEGRFPNGCQPLRPDDRMGISWLTALLPYVEQEPVWQAVEEAQASDPSLDGRAHSLVARTVVPVFLCPSEGRRLAGRDFDDTWAVKSYDGVAGTHWRADDGIFHRFLDVRLTDVTDGTSNTLMIGERPPGPGGSWGAWYARWGSSVCPLVQIRAAGGYAAPAVEATDCIPVYLPLAPGRPDSYCSVTHFWSMHRGGANFAFADGSVRFLTHAASSVLPALATRAGGEPIHDF